MASAILCAILAASLVHAEVKIDDAGKLSLFGDFRGRLETDWDSRRSDGTSRDDRTRLRIRLRAGLTFKPRDDIEFGIRVRSGSDDSQQSPHISLLDFNGNNTGDADFNFDKWYFQYTTGNLKVWLGRNSVPYWHPDELAIDDDVTPAGLGLTYKIGKFDINAGYFSNPAGMRNFSGNSGVLQLVYEGKVGEVEVTYAGGLHYIDADRGNSNNVLYLDDNGDRDYQTWFGNIEARMTAFERPLRLNLDLFHNAESYSASDPDPFTAFHRDESDGFVVAARLGSTSNRGDWLFGYFYSHIETLAINNSFSQDDWLRWGSATQTRTSNFKGSEFRVATGLGNGMNVVARLYIVEGIKLRSATAVTKEDGNRFRIDVNYRF